ncbi:hypothetical protein [Serratia ureilytica]|uniref:hypothetical protein n=1 Tax=Serratia ureilytica TaxID=300181 RepID=UPI0018E8D8BB|nr:hypothetical protein [Serratia ureilytica]MBJ2078371.1 hypothetical protein [Serratia ureilytica]
MLKYQIEKQNARELARHYLSTTGMTGTPAEYLERLRMLEEEFLVLLRQANTR